MTAIKPVRRADRSSASPVRRVEDPDAAPRRGHLHRQPAGRRACSRLAFVRSPIAHAEIESIDTSAAQAMPGVVARVHGRRPRRSPTTSCSCNMQPGRSRARRSPRARVRFVGDIGGGGRRRDHARRRSTPPRRSIVDYDPLPAVTDMDDALAPDAPLLFEALGTNVVRRAARADGTTRSPAPTWSCAGGSRTSAWRSCRWRAPRSRSCPATTGYGHEVTCTSRARCRT